MKEYFLILILLILILLAWSPWQSKEFAESFVLRAFESEQKGVIDGCGFSCEGCGIESSQKIPFGYLINMKYKCGMCGPDCHFRVEKRLVTSFGTSFTVSKY